MSSNDVRYRVVLFSSNSDAAVIEKLKRQIQESGDIDKAKLDQLFSGQPLVLKSDISLDEAEEYRAAILAAGGDCELLPMPEESDADQLGLVERRRNDRRQAEERRKQPRAGWVRDRRKGGRRSTDE